MVTRSRVYKTRRLEYRTTGLPGTVYTVRVNSTNNVYNCTSLCTRYQVHLFFCTGVDVLCNAGGPFYFNFSTQRRSLGASDTGTCSSRLCENLCHLHQQPLYPSFELVYADLVIAPGSTTISENDTQCSSTGSDSTN